MAIDPNLVARFIKHAGNAVYKRHQRDATKHEIDSQITQLQDLSAHPRVNKAQLQRTLMELQKKLAVLLNNETTIISKQSNYASKIEKVSKRISDIDEKVSAYYELDKSRTQRLEQQQKKVNTNMHKNTKEVRLMEEKIRDLESVYHKVKNSGTADHERLEQVKTRLDEFKARLDKLKK